MEKSNRKSGEVEGYKLISLAVEVEKIKGTGGKV